MLVSDIESVSFPNLEIFEPRVFAYILAAVPIPSVEIVEVAKSLIASYRAGSEASNLVSVLIPNAPTASTCTDIVLLCFHISKCLSLIPMQI